MADASGISEDQLAWTAQWYLRQDTLRAANTRLVNAHHAHRERVLGAEHPDTLAARANLANRTRQAETVGGTGLGVN